MTKSIKDRVEDIILSTAQFRVLVEVPGYELRKGIEVALFKHEKEYTAVHYVPSFIGKAKGTRLQGSGKTEESAAKSLARIIGYRANSLEKLSTINKLNAELKNELQYFNSIMVKNNL
ncbi:MAG: hypothetical protein WCX73_01585 [Candidatus Pacearchaeota archaeon]|jgi:hypothetical protein